MDIKFLQRSCRGVGDLSQAVKELASMPKGSKAVVGVCTDDGEGTAALLENS